MRLIDGERLAKKMRELAEDKHNQRAITTIAEALEEIAQIVDELQTVESARQVILCKECIHFESGEGVTYPDWCNNWSNTTEGDWFCSLAKERENE